MLHPSHFTPERTVSTHCTGSMNRRCLHKHGKGSNKNFYLEPSKTTPLRKPRHRENNIKIAHKKICCEDTNEIAIAGVHCDSDIHLDVIHCFYQPSKGSPVPRSLLLCCEQVAGIYTWLKQSLVIRSLQGIRVYVCHPWISNPEYISFQPCLRRVHTSTEYPALKVFKTLFQKKLG
jgi:hypothetical protein